MISSRTQIFFIAFLTLTFISYGQDGNIIDRTQLTSYVEPPAYSTEAGEQYNNAEDLNHPDFGKLTFQAPMDRNVVEVISKRKLDERYYVDLDNPTFFYIEKSAQPINMMKDGYLRAIDPSLYPDGSGNYTSGIQPVTTNLNITSQSTEFTYQNNFFKNNNFQLKIVNLDDSEEILNADWSDIQVNNFGAYITNIFPSIDMKLDFDQGKIKSEFIIKSNPNVKKLVFIDQLEMSNNLNLFQDTSDPIGQHFVEVINSITGETDLLMRPAITYDATESKNTWVSEVVVNGSNIHILCDSAQLNDPSVVYPITVDPTFVAVGPVASGFGVMGSLASPSSCSSSLIINFPAGSTPWDSQVYWEVYSDFCAQILVDFGFYSDCWMSEAQVWISSSCGGLSPTGAPGTVWTCPGCNTIGTWNPTLGFGSSGTQSLAQCYTPSCSNQNLAYTINMNRTYCTSAYGYDDCVWANSYCQSLDQWSVTVQGRSVETLGNTVTGNGSTTIFDGDCAGTQTLDPTPLYGVAPYSYNWSTGGTGATEVVPGTVGTYTCDVTDACGTTVTATFDIGCPLSINLITFDGYQSNRAIKLNWSIEDLSEIEDFEIQKSKNGSSWLTIGSIQAGNTNDYELFDADPFVGSNYYRILFNKKDGTSEKSEVIKVMFKPNLSLFPNPANSKLTVSIDQKVSDKTSIVIRDLMGKEKLREAVKSMHTLIDISELNAGVYVVFLLENEEIIETQRLTVH